MPTMTETESGIQGLTDGKFPPFITQPSFQTSQRFYFTQLIAPLDYQTQVGQTILQDHNNI